MPDQLGEDVYFVDSTHIFYGSFGDIAKHFDSISFPGIGEEAVMSDFCEVLRNNMHEKSSDKFLG